MDLQLVGRNAKSTKGVDSRIDNSRYSSAPPGMKKCDEAARVRNENGNAIGDRYCQHNSPLRGEVAVCFAGSQKPFPSTAMRHDVRAVNLPPDDCASRIRGKLLLETRPPGHHLTNRISTRETERSCVPGRGERVNSKSCEFRYVFTLNRC